MRIKWTVSIILAMSVIGAAARAAEYTITYYNADGSLIYVKSVSRPADADISDYINHYATDDTDKIKVHKLDNGSWDTYEATAVGCKDNLSFTEKAPNVTDQMCRAEYWCDEGSNDLILSADEIKAMNGRIMDKKETMMLDLDNLSEIYNGVETVQSLADFKIPEGLYLHGKPVDASYYEAIRNNIKDVELSDKEHVRYGICTTRTVLKAYPYEEWLSDSEWDREWDEFVNTAVLVGEPVVLYNSTADGKFIYARIACCEGWIRAEDVAVCRDRNEWTRAKTHNNFLVVTGERVWLEPSYDADLSEKQLTMGTVLELSDSVNFSQTNRLAWNNYAVTMPVRNADGSYGEKTALISANRDVNVGYLPYTSANVVKQAFKSLGNRYGWGGMLDSQDCSSFVREVYLCFGLVLPRNTTWQAAMPADITDISDMTDDEKKSVLDSTPPGAILIWSGHEMIYLGEDSGLYYTINDVSSLVSPANPEGGIIRPRSVIVNDLSTLRGNGTTWLSNLMQVAVLR
ncbi:MAG: SH3 domain-containing protein [Clostridia bacterium]|nr:SH3 domain-containing protein [Clostridia bacterium]